MERFRAEEDKHEAERALDVRIQAELGRLAKWCRTKFGEGKWVDASSAWTKTGEEIGRIRDEMVTGDKGWRNFGKK